MDYKNQLTVEINCLFISYIQFLLLVYAIAFIDRKNNNKII